MHPNILHILCYKQKYKYPFFFFFFTFLKSSRLIFVVKPYSPVCLTFNLNTFKQQPLGRCYFANVDLVIHFLKKTNFPFFASLTCH